MPTEEDVHAKHEDHINIIKKGVKFWNKWRETYPDVVPDLSHQDLQGMHLVEVNLRNAYLYSADLRRADLSRADLSGARLLRANLREASIKSALMVDASLEYALLASVDLSGSDLTRVNLQNAKLTGGNLSDVELSDAQLNDADLSRASLRRAKLRRANLTGASFFETDLNNTIFGSNRMEGTNFTGARGLATVASFAGDENIYVLERPSAEGVFISQICHIDLKTVEISSGYLQAAFLSRAAGLSDEFANFLARWGSSPTGDKLVLQTPESLTPRFLNQQLGPYLSAVGEFQRLIDDLKGELSAGVVIKIITQNSPIEISLNGAAEALQQIKDTVSPWRRKHAEKMARLAEQEKRAEIESKKADILEKQAQVAKGRAESVKIEAEAETQRAEAERKRLENEKLRLELQRAKIQLALDILAQIAPGLPETEKICHVIKLLPVINTLALSDLELSAPEQEAPSE